MRRSPSEQLVSERVKSPIAAQSSKQDAEIRENQVQSVSGGTRGVDG